MAIYGGDAVREIIGGSINPCHFFSLAALKHVDNWQLSFFIFIPICMLYNEYLFFLKKKNPGTFK